MNNNSDSLLSSVISWGKVIGIIIGIILALIVFIWLMDIVCASIKRVKTINKIKNAANQREWEIEVLDNINNVISANSKKYEMRLKNGDKTINVKLLSCLHSRATYTLKGLNELIEVKSFSPLLYAPAGFMYYKSVKGAVNPKFTSVNAENGKVYKIDPQFSKSNENNINIICFTPSAHEIMKVEGNQSVTVGNGDIYEGCLLFSGSGLVQYIKNKTEDRKVYA